MAKEKFGKPNQGRRFAKREHELFTEAESDQAHKVEAALASEDHSVQSEIQISDEEFLRRHRASLTSNILPKPPEIPGFHLCWVSMSSNNMHDTVDHRKSIGYSLVKPEEVPSFLNPSNRGGTVSGCISFNELVLMKLPERLYQLYMKDMHHTQPNQQEAVIKQNILNMTDKDGANVARDLAEMSGIRNLARKVPEPKFN